jgi:hypothetical protein
MPKCSEPRVEILCEPDPPCFICGRRCRSKLHEEFFRTLGQINRENYQKRFQEEQRLSLEVAARKFKRKEIPPPIESL